MTNSARYPKQVFWSDEDDGFIAIAPDLPGSSAFGATEAEALKHLDKAIEAWIEAARTAGNSVPVPSRPAAAAQYSGKLLVRMARGLHQRLAEDAHKQNTSLNQLIVTTLAEYLGAADYKRMMQGTAMTSVSVASTPIVNSGRQNVMYFEQSYLSNAMMIECAFPSHTTDRQGVTSEVLPLRDIGWPANTERSLAIYGLRLNQMESAVDRLNITWKEEA